MAKQLDINLAFTADVSKAKQQLNSLQAQLASLTSNAELTGEGLGLDRDLLKATQAAGQLKTMLHQATSSTGKLDLSQLNQSLKQSGRTLQDYANELNSLGPAGRQAFADIAKSVVSAGAPIKKTNKLLEEFSTTLKNTVRWQFSSSMLHGFMGAMQGAYGYAQNLDKSLNNIRIVSGQSADQMAKFAKEANKTARALDTTTAKYTDAALIYYQQGFADESQIKQRTDITTKMSNVTDEDAKEVSSYMTAIWNNFDDGSKSLEHYADVMTALGAATASSTDEIAAGLEKFASISEMIGLSYEYATAALATVTATTRQSADVVGTAFKTIFARIQGLKLGDTLDDGTDLNKYSEALDKVGISIKDQNGELKDMDIILKEMGVVWGDISKDQQVALAQTVAGVRQYNQLVSLMDNWDFFETNLETANTADGELNRQAEIYGESWRAAQKNVTAALETIYSQLLSDDFFISLLGGIETVINAISGLIEGLGGVQGVLLTLGSLSTRIFGKEIGSSIDNAIQNSVMRTKKAQDEEMSLRKSALESMKSLGDASISGSAEVDTFTQQSQLQDAILKKKRALLEAGVEMSEAEQDQVELMVQQSQELSDQILLMAKLREETEKKSNDQSQSLNRRISKGLKKSSADWVDEDEAQSNLDIASLNSQQADKELKSAHQDVMTAPPAQLAEAQERLLAAQNAVAEASARQAQAQEELNSAQQRGSVNADQYSAQIREQIEAAKQNEEQYRARQSAVNKASVEEKKLTNAVKKGWLTSEEAVKQYNKAMSRLEASYRNIGGLDDAFEGLTDVTSLDHLSESIKSAERDAAELGVVASESFDLVRETIAAGGLSASDYSDQLDDIQEQAYLTGDAMLDQAAATAASTEAMEDSQKALDGMKGVTTTFGQQVTDLAGGVAGLIGAAQTIQGLGSLLSDETLSSGEKTVQVVGTLTIALPMLVDSFKQLKAAQLQNIPANLAVALGLEGVAVGSTKAGAAMKMLWTKVFLPFLPIIAAVTAAIGLLYLAFKQSEQASPEYQLTKAKEEAQALTEALSEATDAANQLESAFDNYNSVVDNLNECVKGTEEWTEALKASNQEVITLMQQYPKLASMVKDGQSAVSRDPVTGALRVEGWAIEEMQTDADEVVDTNTAANFYGRQKVRDYEVEVLKKDLVDNLYFSSDGRMLLANRTDADGSLTNKEDPIGLSRLIADNIDAFSNATRKEINSTLTSLMEDNGYAVPKIDLWVDSIVENQLAMQELTSVIDANSAATETESEALVALLLADNPTLNNSSYGEDVTSIIATDYQHLIDAEMQTLENWGKHGISIADSVNTEAKMVFREYAEAAGIVGATLIDTLGSDDNREFKYEDAGGNEQTVPLEVMKAEVAAQKANAAAQEQALKLIASLNQLSESEVARVTAMRTGDTSQLTLGDSQVDTSKITTDETMWKHLGLDEAEYISLWSGLGLESGAAFRAAYTAQITELKEQFNELKTFSKIEWTGIDALGLQEAKNLDDLFKGMNFDQFAISEDSEGQLSDFKREFDALFKDFQDLDPEDALIAFSQVDWSSWDAMDQYREILADMGISLQFSDEKVKSFAEKMRKATQSIPYEKMQKLKDTALDLVKVSKDIDFGSVISEEAYQLLIDYNEELEKYFVLTSEGRKVVGGVEQMKDLSFEEQLAEMDVYQAAYESMDMGSWGHDNSSGEWIATDWSSYARGLKSNDLMAGTLSNILGNEGMQTGLETLGYNLGDLDNLVTTIEDESSDDGAREAARQEMIKFFSEINRFNTAGDNRDFDKEPVKATYAANSTNLADLANTDLDSTEAYSNGLAALASEYDSCREETEEYIEVMNDATKTEEDKLKAQKKLEKALKDAEWNKVTSEVADYLETLEGLKNPEEIAVAYQGIADSLNGVFDTSVTQEFVAENLDLIKKWRNATGVEAQELAMELQAMAVVDSFEPKVDAGSALSQITNLADRQAAIKSIIENNPITVDAYGRADLSGLINSLLDAGVTAESVAAFLTSIGQTDIHLEGVSTELENYDPSNPEEVADAIESIKGDITASGYAPPAANVDMTRLGGGGGGGGSSKNKTRKKTGDETERYHEINEVIEDLTEAFDDLSEARDRAWGVDKSNYIDKEIAKTGELIAAQRQYIAEIQKNHGIDKNAMAGYGASFDINGNISNYDEIVAQQVAKYNAAVDVYNKSGKGESSEKAFETAEENFEKFNEALDLYEDTNGLLADAIREETDLINRQFDLQIEAITEAVESKTSVRDDDLEYLDYKLSKLEDRAFSAAFALSYMGDSVDDLMDKAEYASGGINELLALGNGNSLTADQVDQLREYKSTLIDLNLELLEMRKNIEGNVLESLGEFSEMLDENEADLDNFSNILANYLNIIELSGRASKDSSLILELSGANVDVAMSKLSGAKDELEALVKLQKEAEQELKAASQRGDASSIEMWEKTLADIENQVQEAQLNMQDAWSNALEAAAEKFETTVDIAIAKLEDALSPFLDMDTFSDAYDKAKTSVERYLTETQKVYELNKLIRDIGENIDETDNLAAKVKLKEVLEEVNALQADSAKMSQYDLDHLRAKYELRLAEIALEEAQNAKSQVKLTRDNEGNWGYTYTADQGNIDDAQQNYEDKLNELENLNQDYIDNMSDQIIQNQSDMADALAAIDKNRADYTEEVARVTQFHLEQDKYLRQELDKAVQNSGLVYHDTILGQMENAHSWEEAHKNVKDSTNEAIKEMNDAYLEWKDTVDQAMDEAGTSSEDFTEDTLDHLDDIQQGTEELEESMEETSNNMVDYIGDIMSQVSDWQSEYSAAIDQMIQDNEALIRSTNEALAAQGSEEAYDANDKGYVASVDYTKIMASYLAQGNSKNTDVFKELSRQRTAKIRGENLGHIYEEGSEWDADFTGKAYYNDRDLREQMDIVGISSFQTGGYTGAWGPEGKFATLHEKELVLNAGDTSNFLKAVEIVRAISSTLDQQAMLAGLGLSNVHAATPVDNSTTLEQEVTIHAEFPNVTDRNEIEEAFNNLIGTASQYASRK